MQLENDLQQKEVLVQRVLVRLLCHTSQRAWSYYTSLQGKECGEKKKTKKPHPQQQIPIAENKQGDKKIVSVVKRVHLKVQFLSKWGNKRSNSGRLNAWNKTKCLMNKRSEEEKHPFLTKSRKKINSNKQSSGNASQWNHVVFFLHWYPREWARALPRVKSWDLSYREQQQKNTVWPKADRCAVEQNKIWGPKELIRVKRNSGVQ